LFVCLFVLIVKDGLRMTQDLSLLREYQATWLNTAELVLETAKQKIIFISNGEKMCKSCLLLVYTSLVD